MDDLFLAVAKLSEGNKSETLAIIDNILDMVEQDIDSFRDRVKEEALESGLCPKCFEKMEVAHIGELSGECWGSPFTEPIEGLICEYCGYQMEG